MSSFANSRTADVYDRLTNPRSYTGVYAKRFEEGGDGRINAQTDTSVKAYNSAFVGNTNTGTDETIRDIAYLMRPNLKGDTGLAFSDKEVARRIQKERANRAALPKRSPQRRVIPARKTDVYKRRGKAALMRRRSMSDHEAKANPASSMDHDRQTIDVVRDVFLFYCRFGKTGGRGSREDSMDSFMFMKFIKECPNLLDRRDLTRAEVDLIFTKAKPKQERRLDFKHFLDALGAVSMKRYPDMNIENALNVLIANHVFALPCVTGEMPPPPQRKAPSKPSPSYSAYESHERDYAEHAHRRAVRQIVANEGKAGFYGNPNRLPKGASSKGASHSALDSLSRQDWERLHAHASDSAHLAGEANRPGGVYDRLSSTTSYTGVYKRRFEGDGRIGHHADMHMTAKASSYKGNTNTGTDETIHDISRTFRTNLGVGTPGAGRYMKF